MQMVFYPIIFMIFFLLVIFVANGLTISRSPTNKKLISRLIAEILVLIVLIGVFFLFVFKISPSNGSGSSDSSFGFLIPIIAGFWIPIMASVSAQKKKSAQSISQTMHNSNLTPQQDEINNIRFCLNCGSQYSSGDQYCMMCGSRL